LADNYDDDISLTDYTLGQDQLEKIENILTKDLVDSGVHSVLLIDMAGNIIAKGDSGRYEHDLYSFPVVAPLSLPAAL
jgi:hypothetical protein